MQIGKINFLNLIFKNYLLLFLVIVFIFYTIPIIFYPSFWSDEAVDISTAWSLSHRKGLTSPVIFDLSNKQEQGKVYLIHPPFPILLMTLIVKFFDIHPVLVHLLPVLFGFGSLVIFYYLITNSLGKKIAVWSLIIMAINPLFFLMSRQVRPEIFVVFFAILSLLFLHDAYQKGKIWSYFLSGISSGLCILSHYYGIFLVVTVLILLIFIQKFPFSRKERTKALSLFLLGVILVLLPFIYILIKDFNFYLNQFSTFFLNSKINNKSLLFKIINCIFLEKERYLYHKKALGILGILILGFLLYFKFLYTKIPSLLLFSIVFLGGLSFFPNKAAVYYLLPIIPLASLIVAMMMKTEEYPIYFKKMKIVFKIIAYGYIGFSMFYFLSFDNITSAYFEAIPYLELKKFSNLVGVYCGNGRILGEPVYFLFLTDKHKLNFLVDSFVVQLSNINYEILNKLFTEKKICIYAYSPDTYKYWYKKDESFIKELEQFLERRGRIIQIIQRGTYRDFIYLIKS